MSADLVLLDLVGVALLLNFAWRRLVRFADAQARAMPKPGETWRLVPRETPWPSERELHLHRVLDVRGGWVKHAFLYNGKECEPDCTRLDTFLRVFKRDAEAGAASATTRGGR